MQDSSRWAMSLWTSGSGRSRAILLGASRLPIPSALQNLSVLRKNTDNAWDRVNSFRTEGKDRTMSYQPIENYGIISNMRTVALVGMHGSIDWYCYPTSIRPAFFGGGEDDTREAASKSLPTLMACGTSSFIGLPQMCSLRLKIGGDAEFFPNSCFL